MEHPKAQRSSLCDALQGAEHNIRSLLHQENEAQLAMDSLDERALGISRDVDAAFDLMVSKVEAMRKSVKAELQQEHFKRAFVLRQQSEYVKGLASSARACQSIGDMALEKGLTHEILAYKGLISRRFPMPI